MSKWGLACALLLGFSAFPASAQPVFSRIFPPEEFAARRARVIETIGDGVAILQGTTERPGEQPLRQSNQFYYLAGVVEPRAILVIDGKSKLSTLFLADGGERRQRMFGSALFPGTESAKSSGLDAVMARSAFTGVANEIAKSGRTIYTPFRPEVLGSASAGDAVSLARNTKEDPWDGRLSREDVFIQKLKVLGAEVKVENLDPILDRMRAFKSPREIETIREATRITGRAIMEVMRDVKPGQLEYELQAVAEYVFKKHGSYGPAYFALVATGTNTPYSHYHANTAQLRDGDLVQFDYAPDYNYYVSDVTRVFPANGKFTARQREFYTIYLRLYQALMTSIKPHVAPRDIVKAAVVKMDQIMSSFKFTDPKIKDAATRFVERYRASTGNSLGHTVGMEVHDVRLGTETLQPGQLFTIEPAMIIPDEKLGMRLEDVILITDKGYENLSAFVPVEIDEIEKLMAETGISEGYTKRLATESRRNK
jgi:Xaa-Pro aminopeptidase